MTDNEGNCTARIRYVESVVTVWRLFQVRASTVKQTILTVLQHHRQSFGLTERTVRKIEKL
jgi:hypothetical protein